MQFSLSLMRTNHNDGCRIIVCVGLTPNSWFYHLGNLILTSVVSLNRMGYLCHSCPKFSYCFALTLVTNTSQAVTICH